MRLCLDGRTYSGPALDVRGTGARVADVVDELGLDGSDPLSTATTDPPPVADALVAAATERGQEPQAAARVRRLEARLAAIDETLDATTDVAGALTAARERAATAGRDVSRLRERVATLRGRRNAVTAATGTDTAIGEDGGESAADAFTETMRALTDAETERVAAAQALARADERASERRDARERRLRLRDALANARRDRRRAAADSVAPAFADAVATVAGADPDDCDGPSTGADPPTGDDLAARFDDAVVGHLAAIRLAARDDPVVVAVSRFETACDAARRLRAPVVLLDPE